MWSGYGLNDIEDNTKDGISLKVQKGMMKDQESCIHFSIFGETMIDKLKIQNDVVYRFDHPMVSKFSSTRYLKTTGTTTAEVLTDHDIAAPSQMDQYGLPKVISVKVVKLNLSSLNEKLTCSTCNEEVQADDGGFVMCD